WAAMLPPAPPLFSTTTCWPQSSVNRLASTRAIGSAEPPGGNGTTKRTYRLGYDCPQAKRAATGRAAAPAASCSNLRRGPFTDAPPQWPDAKSDVRPQQSQVTIRPIQIRAAVFRLPPPSRYP